MPRPFILVPPGLAWLVPMVAGCTPSAQTSAAPYAEVTCPGSLADAVSATCPMEGLKCYPQYPCGILPSIATCTCTGGVFACVDVTGRAVEEGGAPRCPPPQTAGTCPATEVLATLRPCTETGLMCPYPSTCPAGQKYDQCVCMNGPLGDGQTGLRFECPPPCDSDAALVDAGTASAYDATLTDAAPADAPMRDAVTADAPREAD